MAYHFGGGGSSDSMIVVIADDDEKTALNSSAGSDRSISSTMACRPVSLSAISCEGQLIAKGKVAVLGGNVGL
jgi:hypothetical protein